MKVLIADDRPRESKLLAALVRDMGHEVLVAQNGREALRLLSAEAPPEVVLLDWMMPGPDGASLSSWLHSHLDAKLPQVVVITGRNGGSTQPDRGPVDSFTPWRDQLIRSRIAKAEAVMHQAAPAIFPIAV